MRKTSIANRWFFNSFSVIAILLVVLNIAFYFAIRSFYYNSTKQYIETEAGIVAGVLERFYDDTATDYTEEMRTAVEEFEKKNYAELMAINAQGKVFLSSSGFSPAEHYTMPDYEQALKSENGTGYHTGYLENTEKYMAVSILLNSNKTTGNAIRIITSLERIDAQVTGLTVATSTVSVVIILILLTLGMYFIKSIIRPIRNIGSSARKLATGDFSVRIEAEHNDEIGELCTVFNYMADELESSENIKNEFISSVSHELRTPLTAIKGWSETITEIDDERMRKKGLGIITRETERLSAMVEELLDFSRMQNGKLSLQTANIDIIAELADAVLMYGEKAKDDKITIDFEESEDIAIVNGDKNRLRQVFINIIDNAIKYSEAGDTVSIKTAKDDDEIIIYIEDNGCGISKTDLPKIKNRFYKANNTVRGSGIGLAVADEIVKMHSGKLDISSELGKGTTVSISLPLI
ncbi:MAG: HAMP domain-containing histidine kinase [Ruminiclostridium sp.]|nr:HAMP domain-containing histidine kinase [Ruminiclostridium sp.]